jgi:hypothetical protein
MTLLDDLETEIAKQRRLGRKNYGIHYALSIVAVFSSFFAGLSVALSWFGNDTLAILSSLPATVLIASDRFSFSAKTKWYYGKAFALQAILSALQYEELTVAEASRRRTAVNCDFEERWPGIAEAPK